MNNLTGLRKICQLRGIKNSHSFNTKKCLKELGKTKFTKEEEKAYYEAIERRKEQRRKKLVEKVIIKNDDVELLKTKIKDLEEISDIENDNVHLTKELITIKKSIQKKDDQLRIFRKKEREYNRELNVLEVLTKETIGLLRKQGNDIKIIKHKSNYKDEEIKKGITQFSDLHSNEKIEILGNKFDFEILSKRIKYKVQKDIKLFKKENIKDVLIAFTGDLLNSDRRLGEILTNSTNRAKAIFNLKDILLGAILEYAEHFNVSVASIIGNESRMDEDIHFEEQIASNNFDYMVFRMLAEILHNKVDFAENTSSLETVVNVNDQNILLLHGHSLKKNVENDIPKLKTKYSDQGILIRYVISGHIHSTLGSSQFSRSASVAGGNAYSFYALNLSSRAQQNSYIVHKNGNIDVVVQDLQSFPENLIPYDFSNSLDCYTEKSLDKYKKVNGIKIYKV